MVAKNSRIRVDAIAELAGWSPKAFQAALDRSGEGPRTGLKPRAAKIGGRYAFALADVIDAAIARPLIRRGVTIEDAYRFVRPATDRLFGLVSGRDIDPNSMIARAENQLLEVWFQNDSLVDVRVRSDLLPLVELQQAPAGANLRFEFRDGDIVLIFSAGHILRSVIERAGELGLDLSRIEHGPLA